MKKSAIVLAILLAGCNAKTPPDTSVGQADPQTDAQTAAQGTQEPQNQSDVAPQDYTPPAAQPVVSVYVDPPLEQPAPIRVDWAPPPMLEDPPPPQPSDNDVWTGGYWVWEGQWVWAHGDWAPPPRPGYEWNNPYYEHRDNSVIFVNGYWSAPGVSFVPPPVGVDIALGVIGIGVIAGMRANGPEGVFVPAPPGSYRGLIVPAPIGTAPAVVVGSAPIIRTGMRVTVNNQSNITNIRNETNVTVIAPATAMANGKALNVSVPARPQLAAAQSAMVSARAPDPASGKHIPAYVAGHKPIALPAAQEVHPEVPSSLMPAHSNPHGSTAATPAIAPNRSIPAQPAHVEPARPASPVAHSPNQPIEHSPVREPERAVPRPAQAAVAAPHQPVVEPRVETNKVENKPAPRAEPPAVKEVPPVPVVTPHRAEPTEQNMHTKVVPAKPEKKEEHRPPENNGHE